MKMLSVLLVALALIANSSVSATPPMEAQNSATILGDEGVEVGFYVTGHGPNPTRAEKDAWGQLWDAIIGFENATGLTFTGMEITGEGPIGSTIYFIECICVFEDLG